MPLIPPKTMRVRAPALGSGDDSTTTTRVQDTTGNALDRLLRFISTAFAQGNNALTVLLPTTFSKAVTYAGDVAVKGALSVAGAATASSFVSAQGFKSFVGPWYYDSAGANFPGSIQQMAFGAYVNSGTPTSSRNNTYPWVAPYSGSVLALSGRGAMGATALFNIGLYKNSALQGLSVNSASVAAGTQVSASVTAVKGVYSFVAGDLLEIRVNYNAITNASTAAYMVVEMGA